MRAFAFRPHFFATLTRCFRQWEVMRLSPLSQRTGLSPADHQKATGLSREMALFTRLQGGAAPSPRVTPDFARTARQDYADQLALYGRAQLPASFVVQKLSTLPAPVAAAFHDFQQRHPGRAEIAPSPIAGQVTWQAQVVQVGGAQVLLLDQKGHELARGVVRGAAVSWQAQSSSR